MKNFKMLERFMTPTRLNTLIVVLGVSLAAWSVFAVLASFGALLGGHPIAFLASLFSAIAIPLAIWMVVWTLSSGSSVTGTQVALLAEDVRKANDHLASIKDLMSAKTDSSATTPKTAPRKPAAKRTRAAAKPVAAAE